MFFAIFMGIVGSSLLFLVGVIVVFGLAGYEIVAGIKEAFRDRHYREKTREYNRQVRIHNIDVRIHQLQRRNREWWYRDLCVQPCPHSACQEYRELLAAKSRERPIAPQDLVCFHCFNPNNCHRNAPKCPEWRASIARWREMGL